MLFSAAYRPTAGVLRLWEVGNAELITSAYAAEEARRNLLQAAQQARLDGLLKRVRVVPEAEERAIPDTRLPDKDRPILLAAQAAQATHLVTGDVTHFGRYFGRRLAGVLVLPPAEYLKKRMGGRG
ncbi:MAG: DNA-binding protein [Gemmatimonadetes bacterium]|nr:DNA-binding protein [Gemmatimonadota bacterium]